jgi:hypothetical protein
MASAVPTEQFSYFVTPDWAPPSPASDVALLAAYACVLLTLSLAALVLLSWHARVRGS